MRTLQLFGFGVGSSRAASGPTAGFLNHSFDKLAA
jgi:hypothetical protein